MIARPMRNAVLAALIAAMLATACQSAAPSSTPSDPPTAPSGTPGAGSPSPFPNPSGGTGQSDPPASGAPRLDQIAIALEPFAKVRGAAIGIAAPDDGTGRMFVATQGGKIWVIQRNGVVNGEPMLDIGSLISNGGEQGLLGIATHPTFPTDPRIFLNYTNTEGDSIVASAALDPGDSNRLDPSTLTKLLFVDQPYVNHNGGSVQFGSDGKLYLSFGDGGSAEDPQHNAQNLQVLLGKILRIDIDGSPAAGPYIVPQDNPYASGGGLPEIWHWGLRNPWRMSFDRANGDLWIGDVGQDSFEEVDVARRGTSNLNFGWSVMEGAHCLNGRVCDTDGLTLPVSEYGQVRGCTVIGGYVYRGARYAFLVGAYLFADYCSGTIFAIDAASDEPVAPVVVGSGPGRRISGFGEDVAGELYVTSLDGDVFRVVATER